MSGIYVSLFDFNFTMEPPSPDLGDPSFSSQFGRTARIVPVAHIFGYASNYTGCSIVLHLHGTMPYFFVPQYDSGMSGASFAALLEQTANEKVFGQQYGGGMGGSDGRLIHHVEVVEGVDFYGYHCAPRRFYKIFVYNPTHIHRLANLLGSTCFVGGRRWQPYESHIPFQLQIMADLGLNGMSNVKVTKGKFRQPLPEGREPPPAGGASSAPAPSISEQIIQLVHESTAMMNKKNDDDDDDDGGDRKSGKGEDHFYFSLLPPDDPPRMGRRDNTIEIDITVEDLLCASSSYSNSHAAPGASFRTCRAALRKYLLSVGQPADEILNRAADLGDGLQRRSVGRVQAADDMVGCMRRRAIEIEMELRQQQQQQPVAEQQHGDGGASSLLSDDPADAAAALTSLERPRDKVLHSGVRLHELERLHQEQQQQQQQQQEQSQDDPYADMQRRDSEAAKLEEADLQAMPTFGLLQQLAQIDVATFSQQIMDQARLTPMSQENTQKQDTAALLGDSGRRSASNNNNLLLFSDEKKRKSEIIQFLSLERRRSSRGEGGGSGGSAGVLAREGSGLDRFIASGSAAGSGDGDEDGEEEDIEAILPRKSQIGFLIANGDDDDDDDDESESENQEEDVQQETTVNEESNEEDIKLFPDSDDDDGEQARATTNNQLPHRRSREIIVISGSTSAATSQRPSKQLQQQQQQQGSASATRRKTVTFVSPQKDDTKSNGGRNDGDVDEHSTVSQEPLPLFPGDDDDDNGRHENPEAAIARLLFYSQPQQSSAKKIQQRQQESPTKRNAVQEGNNDDDDDAEIQLVFGGGGNRSSSVIEIDCSSSSATTRSKSSSTIFSLSSAAAAAEKKNEGATAAAAAAAAAPVLATPPEQLAGGDGGGRGDLSAIKNALCAFKKLRTPHAGATVGEKKKLVVAAETSTTTETTVSSDSLLAASSVSSEQHTIEHLSQLMRLMTHPSMPFLTVVTPRHTLESDARAQGFKRANTKQQQQQQQQNRSSTKMRNSDAAATSASATQQHAGASGPLLSNAPPATKLSFLKIVSIEGLLAAPPGLVGCAATQPLVSVVVSDTTASVDSCCSVLFTTLGGLSKQHAVPAPLPQVQMRDFATEADMLRAVIDLLSDMDPDVIVSWNLIRGGFGSFVERCHIVLQVDVAKELSRLAARESGVAAGTAAGAGPRRSDSLFGGDNNNNNNNNEDDDDDDDDGFNNDDDDDLMKEEEDGFGLKRGGPRGRGRGRFGGGGGGGGGFRRGAFSAHFTSVQQTSTVFGGAIGCQQPPAAAAGAATAAGAANPTPNLPSSSSTAAAVGGLAAVLGMESNGNAGGISRMGGDAARSDALPLAGPQQIKIHGRVPMALWKLVRTELKQKSYTLQAVHQSLFGRPFPHIADDTLFAMASSPREDRARHAANLHLLSRSVVSLRVCRHLDVFVRSAELAQINGILMYEVLARGSQFKVESCLMRYTKPLGFVNASPTREQVMLQNRQEGIALVMEPRSQFCADPLLVLDFRSLYPSICIAYNLCYSTLLGKVVEGERVQIGAIRSYRRPAGAFAAEYIAEQEEEKEVADNNYGGGENVPAAAGSEKEKKPDFTTFAPNSAGFVPSVQRRGVIPCMLNDILSTRFQVQAAMKVAGAAGDDEQRRVLDAQQAGLKLLANVTYGYTAATFTGRMPCSDVADSIVLLGRQTLERAIRRVEGTPGWAATVEYADTDSMFVRLPGRSKEEAFRIGREMVAAVNRDNPSPVTIKLEKCYMRSFLITKKRYVGYAYESPEQERPKFDAKGIETVRRDQCPATAQVMTEALRLWFDTMDMHRLKRYIVEQLSKILRGDMRPNSLILRREVKLGTYSSEASLPPGARVAMRKMMVDPAAAPQQGERVPYVVVHTDSQLLKNSVVPAAELLQNQKPYHHVDDDDGDQQQQQQKQQWIPNGQHYIDKHIVPSLQRVLHLIGLDVRHLAKTMPKMLRRRAVLFEPNLVVWRPGGPSLLAAAHQQQRQQQRQVHQKKMLQNSPSKGAAFVNLAQQQHNSSGSSSSSNNSILVQLATAAAHSVGRSTASSVMNSMAARRSTTAAASSTTFAGGGGITPQIHLFYQTALCAVCQKNQTPIGSFGYPPVCRGCLADRPNSLAMVHGRRRACEAEIESLDAACRECVGCASMPDGGVTALCDSVDCDAPFDRQRVGSLRAQFALLCDFLGSDESEGIAALCFGSSSAGAGAGGGGGKKQREVVVL